MAIVSTAAAITILVGVVTWLAKEAWTWVKEAAHAAARAAAAIAVWTATHAAVRYGLYLAILAVVEAFATYLVASVVTPFAGNVFSRLLPSASAGEFFYYIFWDSGLHAKRIADVILLYLANYTLLWGAFDRWLRGMSIALGVYKSGLRRQEAVLNASLTK